jgi:hypothetical protein
MLDEDLDEPSSFNEQAEDDEDFGLMCEINNSDLIKTVTIKSPNSKYIR